GASAHHAIVTGLLGAILADLGVKDAARHAFDRAGEALRAATDQTALAALDVFRGHLDLASGHHDDARHRLVPGLANLARWREPRLRRDLDAAPHGPARPAPARRRRLPDRSGRRIQEPRRCRNLGTFRPVAAPATLRRRDVEMRSRARARRLQSAARDAGGG